MARGRNEESGIYREFLDAVDRARSDFLLLANRRLNQLATGGVVRVPKFDKTGSPIRKHHKDCDGQSGCGCELEFVEKVLLPNPNVLMWQVDRIDPNPNGEPQLPGLPEAPELNSAEQIAEAAKYFEMYKEGVQILIDLGCPPKQLLESSKDIDTTATHPKPEPEPEAAPQPAPEPTPPKSSPFRKHSNPAHIGASPLAPPVSRYARRALGAAGDGDRTPASATYIAPQTRKNRRESYRATVKVASKRPNNLIDTQGFRRAADRQFAVRLDHPKLNVQKATHRLSPKPDGNAVHRGLIGCCDARIVGPTRARRSERNGRAWPPSGPSPRQEGQI